MQGKRDEGKSESSRCEGMCVLRLGQVPAGLECLPVVGTGVGSWLMACVTRAADLDMFAVICTSCW